MQNKLRNFITPPIFPEDDEKTRLAGLLNSILFFLIIALSLALPILAGSTEVGNRLPLFIVGFLLIVANIAAYIFMRRGNVTLATYIFLIGLAVAIFGSYAASSPQSVGAPLSLSILIAFTTLLLGGRAIIRLIAFIIAFTSVVILAQSRGWITPVFSITTDPVQNWVSISFVFILTGLALYLASVSLRRALDNSLAARASLQATNQELDQLQKVLEQRVAQRTAELEKRASQLQIISNMARAITSMQDLNTLLTNITKLVSDQFGFYHTGIFLLDEANEYAVLQAANSEGGIGMLNRGHRLPLDSDSIVGYATSRGEPRIALDVGADSAYFSNPDLPETRAELALPLRVVGRVIGALDVQSTETNAFSQDDIFVLYTLADQIAIAIENARLYGQAQKALRDSQATFDKYVKQEWSSFVQQARHNGFVFDGKHVMPLDKQAKRDHVKPVIQTGSLSLERSSSTIAVPIKLRGQTIGVLDVRSKKGSREWSADEIALLEAAAERAALALENARLVESAQRRASRERSIGEISAKIGSVSDIDSILQAAVEELGRKLSGATEVTLEISHNDQQAFQS
ncbi:MAG: GAF domain-containing protein [Chloroflexota bacterium]